MTDDRTHGSGDAVDVVVIGGGVAGLAVAHDLARAGVRVVLLEAADELGGLLRRGRVAGIDIDLGAESFATRTDAVARLVADAGLPLDLVRPQPGGAALVLADPSGVGGVTSGYRSAGQRLACSALRRTTASIGRPYLSSTS